MASPSPKPTSSSSQDKIKDAIKIGQDLIRKKMTKAEASMVMYRLLHEAGCDQEVIADAFVKGASLTPMGARTYFYNCRRKYRAEQKAKAEKSDNTAATENNGTSK